MMWLWGGLMLGFAGSLHCAAMCGPLVAGFRRGGMFAGDTQPARRSDWARHAPLEGAVYQAARVGTYAALGATAGAAGHVAALRVNLALAMGVMLIAMALASAVSWTLPGMRTLGRGVGRALSAVRNRAYRRGLPADAASAASVQRRRAFVAAAAGALNALLPCGLVYAALMAALATATVGGAALFMLAFGVGTLPVMSAAWMASAHVSRMPPRVRRFAAPAAMMLVGLLLIGRATADRASPSHGAHVHVTVAIQ